MTIVGIGFLQYALGVVLHFPGRLHYADRVERLIRPGPWIVSAYDVSNRESGRLAK